MQVQGGLNSRLDPLAMGTGSAVESVFGLVHLDHEAGWSSPEVAGSVLIEDAELNTSQFIVVEWYAVEYTVAADGILVSAAVNHQRISA